MTLRSARGRCVLPVGVFARWQADEKEGST